MIQYDIFKGSGSYAVHFSDAVKDEVMASAQAYADSQLSAHPRIGSPVTDGTIWLVTVFLGSEATLPTGALQIERAVRKAGQ
jgi:hypothetical protein